MPRTRFELSQKMRERDVPEQAIDVVLHRFEELKLIDDRAFATAWVESRARSKGFARSRLKQELRRKGVGAQDLEAALEQIDGDEERVRCQELALKKLGTRTLPPAGPGQEDRAERDKVLRRLLGFLARKGYPGGVAMSAARSAMDRHDQGERG
ncbi:regulatory protein RecX [Galactobacter caseinivorans]|uniref:Regulatory protein RecX n=2 Tax=Galactobacter caseinivorans TaxID=2676123 RepID=A0A496PKA4_9MICC|nr:regulatory protein RecX [Galactobacter caseinivorans]